MNTHQLEINDIERDLLLCALDLWAHRLGKDIENVSASGHWHAARFTKRRIAALKLRLEGLAPVEGATGEQP